MAGDRLKFRCYRCGQLLAVAPSRAGKIVACPKCKADLQIPALDGGSSGEMGAALSGEPGAAPGTRAQAGGPGESGLGADSARPQLDSPAVPSVAAGSSGFIPPDIAELRPEDLRVEADVLATFPRRSAADAASVEPDASRRFPSIESPEAPVAWPTAEELSNAFAASAPPVEPEQEVPPPLDAAALLPEEKLDAAAPPIAVETPATLKPVEQPRHVREVIVPASVVLIWSLFGLAGLALAFIAGLLIGHFLWKAM